MTKKKAKRMWLKPRKALLTRKYAVQIANPSAPGSAEVREEIIKEMERLEEEHTANWLEATKNW